MWYCPRCGEPIEDAFDACWRCGTGRDGAASGEFHPEPEDPSVPDPGPEPEVAPRGPGHDSGEHPAGRLVTVAVHDIAGTADAERLLLEQEGIPTFLADDDPGVVSSSCPNGVGGTRLQVRASDALRAAAILERHWASRARTEEALAKAKVRFPCQTCGTIITVASERCGHVETCPACGSYVDVPEDAEGTGLAEPAATAANAVAGSAATEQAIAAGAGSRTTLSLWIEVLAVLCLAYVPALFSGLSALTHPHPADRSYSFAWMEFFRIVTALEVVAPLLVIMALSRDPWRLFGIARPIWLMDALGGYVIWLGATAVRRYTVRLLPLWIVQQSVPPRVAQSPEGVPAYFLLLMACMAAAFAEELAMRGYLIPRLEQLLRSTWVAVLLTSVMFGSYHIYQGMESAVGAAAAGVVYGLSFCLLRRLWPVCVAHALHNFLLYL
jgi:membrane protease YdiL (CAAX protease family)/predicted RNA-binding Zn-ribbon protein involved in translation (DUF1610 family)